MECLIENSECLSSSHIINRETIFALGGLIYGLKYHSEAGTPLNETGTLVAAFAGAMLACVLSNIGVLCSIASVPF